MNQEKSTETINDFRIIYEVDGIIEILEKARKRSKKPVIGLLFKTRTDEVSFDINEVTFNWKKYKRENFKECVGLGKERDLSIKKRFWDSQRQSTERVPTSIGFEFWDEKPANYIYFSIYQLAMVAWGTDELIMSGTEIRYGKGHLSYKESYYPTLKAECSNKRNNTNKYNPNVVVGAPCPTQWGVAKIAGDILQIGKTTQSQGFLSSTQVTAENIITSINNLFI